MQLIIKQFPPLSWYFLPVMPKYFRSLVFSSFLSSSSLNVRDEGTLHETSASIKGVVFLQQVYDYRKRHVRM